MSGYTGFNSLAGYQISLDAAATRRYTVNMETDFRTLRLDRICEKTRNVQEIRRELATQIKLWRKQHNHIDSQILMLKIRMLKWVLNHDTRRF